MLHSCVTSNGRVQASSPVYVKKKLEFFRYWIDSYNIYRWCATTKITSCTVIVLLDYLRQRVNFGQKWPCFHENGPNVSSAQILYDRIFFITFYLTPYYHFYKLQRNLYVGRKKYFFFIIHLFTVTIKTWSPIYGHPSKHNPHVICLVMRYL